MTTPLFKSATVLAVVALSFPAGAILRAQTLPGALMGAQGNARGTNDNDAAVQMTPFDVAADSDKSYGALNSNSITRFSTELDHMPISADIFNEAFMRDINASGVEDMIQGYAAGAGAATPTLSVPSANASGDRNGSSLALRGLIAPTIQRDGFMTAAPTASGFTSNFDVERVEIINGPQSLLYGVGGAGGVVNVISKQARFNQSPFGSFDFKVDQFGHKQGQLDYGVGTQDAAVRLAFISQTVGDRRVNVGGPMSGIYAQIAVKIPGNTVLRLNLDQTKIERIVPFSSLPFTAASTANDARNGKSLRYLLASNQINSSATGASGAGVIGNGMITWDNVDSYTADWNQEEIDLTRTITLAADSTWGSHLTSELQVGYRGTVNDRTNATTVFAAPNLATNPTGTWAVGELGSIPLQDFSQPSRQKSIRFSVLATNEFFGGRVGSKAIIGADFTRTDGFQTITHTFVKSDGNFVPLTTNTALPSGYVYPTTGLWWSVANGPVEYPLWDPLRQNHATYAGQNYTKVLTNVVNPTLIGPGNPLGTAPGGSGTYQLSEAENKGVYGASYTQWLDKKLDVLLGARLGQTFSAVNATASPPLPPSTRTENVTSAVSFNAGADYAILPWLRPYVSASSSYDPAPFYLPNPINQYPKASYATGEEVGLKVTNPSATLSGSLAFYHISSKNEELSLTTTLVLDINPSGLNGVYGAPAGWVNVDRKTQGVQVALDAAPTSNWRMRLSAAMTGGTVNSTRSFPQLYNDQFYENSSGQVTYKDGTVVYVNATASTLPVASTTAGAVPLTVTKMSTSGDPYYANPVAITGAINPSAIVYQVLKSSDPVHGSIRTGITGLPISQQQINPGFTPPGSIVTSVAGEDSTGYPKYSIVLTEHYTFSSGWLKGVGLGLTGAASWQFRAYYFYPNGLTDPNNSPRTLFSWPTRTKFDGVLSYERKLGKHMGFITQLNVSNMFNHYHVVILPAIPNGYAGVLGAAFDQQPRVYVWSNTFSF